MGKSETVTNGALSVSVRGLEVALEFVGVSESQRRPIVGQPVREGGGPGGGSLRVGQTVGHCSVFITSQQHVTERRSHDPGEERKDEPGNPDQHRTTPDDLPDGSDQLNEGGSLGSYGVAHAIKAFGAFLKTELGEIVDVNCSDAVVTSTAYGENRKMTKQPGDVIDQDAVTAEEDGRTQHRVGHARLGQGPFDQSFAAKVGKRGVCTGMGNTDVHDALDAGEPRGLEERARVVHC